MSTMSYKFIIYAVLLLIATPLLFARAQITSSTTILVPSDYVSGILQMVTNLFALNSFGTLIIMIVGVILALIAIEFLIRSLHK